jgi:hypothetical protein
MFNFLRLDCLPSGLIIPCPSIVPGNFSNVVAAVLSADILPSAIELHALLHAWQMRDSQAEHAIPVR